MTRTVILKPTYGAEDRDHGRCKRALEALGINIIELEDCPYIDMARAYLVDRALDEFADADVLVFIDHDIIFKASDVPMLAEHCRTSKYDILGVLYSMRRPRFTTIGRPEGTPTVDFYVPGLIDGDFTGLGMTAIKRYVFERMRQDLKRLECPTVGRAVHPYFRHLIDDSSYLGEDISFCYRAKELGFTIGIDTEPRIFHRGRYDYALEDTGLAVPDYQPLTIRFTQGTKIEIPAAE